MAEKQAHTPGPWEIRRHDEDAEHRADIEIRGPARMYRAVPIHDFIAKVQADWNTCEEWEANARLIAAVPDLLAACKALLPEGWDDGTMDHMPGVKLAREAIAKAEGQP